jgi:hypothetical protein
MKLISSVFVLLGLTLLLLACAHEEGRATGETAKGTVIVKQLPAGVEGVELKDGSLRLKPGYKFEKRPQHQFAVIRISDGRAVTSGGCGCTGGTCDPVLKGGIGVCEGSGCTGHCGLALTVAGIKTTIINY